MKKTNQTTKTNQTLSNGKDAKTLTDAKNVANVKETSKTDVTAIVSNVAPEPKEPKKIKLNADSYKDWKFQPKTRVLDEETEPTPRQIHLERMKRESEGYYNTRRGTFDLTLSLTGTGKEYRTPQNNMELIKSTLNSKLPKDRQITRFVYVARNYELRFYPMDKPKNDFIAINVSKPIDVENVLKSFGISR